MTPADYQRERQLRGTQSSVAALLGIDPQTISRRERGEIPVTREAAMALTSLRKAPIAKGAKIGARLRQRTNSLTDADRETTRQRGMQIIYDKAVPGSKKPRRVNPVTALRLLSRAPRHGTTNCTRLGSPVK